MAFAGPGYLVAVGYMDPGNWATGIAGGSAYGYALLWVIVLSNFMAMLLQTLAARLGIATGRDLAQACRDHYPKHVALALWALAELAICATDLAEVIGTAIALNLLFHMPLAWGVCLTVADVLLVLWLQQRGLRYLEVFTASLVFLVLACFVIELALAQPSWIDVAHGLVPGVEIYQRPGMLYLALGIVGATVMPHNLYLHSSLVQTRRYARDESGRRSAAQLATLDVVAALCIALLINGAILILAATAFHETGHYETTQIQDAYHLLSPVIGTSLASVLFAVALLASGKSSTIAATLAGQIVMEGFLTWKVRPWLRRLMTRALAICPALVAVTYYGEEGLGSLMLVSQAALSLQLPFAMIPLLRFTGDAGKMGTLVSPPWMRIAAWAVALLIISLGAATLLQG